MSYDLAILILRVVIGLTLAAHGAQKLFGWFGGPGLAGLTKGFTHMRLRPAALWALFAGLAEFSGVLFALGFLSPLGSLGIISAMLVATLVAHWPRFFATKQGFEYCLVILAVGLAVGITGPGAYSIDNLIGFSLPEPTTLLIGLVLVIIGVAVTMLSRAPQVVEAAPTPATQATAKQA